MTNISNGAMPKVLSINLKTFGQAVVAGLVGLIVWEIFARLFAPFWIGGPLDPTQLIEMVFGVSGFAGELIHIATALVAFPLAYVFVVLPLATMMIPGAPWPILGIAYGAALWVFAMYVIASLIGGMPPFLGFQQIAWASLVGHLGLGLGIAGATSAFNARSK